jgi:ABC-type antimicrobial peptide transport system permease subunit
LEVLIIFAGAALLLAMIGIYGVMAWSVGQRSREISLRMALGARRSTVVMLVFRQGIRLALSGIAAGLIVAASLSRVMASMLYDVKPDDGATFAVVTVGMTAIALLSCVTPALRAASVDPSVMLRSD